jgi:hypothetical protein
MTRIMERARAAQAAAQAQEGEFAAAKVQESTARATRAAEQMFGATPDKVVIPDRLLYAGTVGYEDLTLRFTEDDDYTRFFWRRGCPSCMKVDEVTVYCLADLAKIEEIEYTCPECLALPEPAPSAWEELTAEQRQSAARLYTLARMITGAWRLDPA